MAEREVRAGPRRRSRKTTRDHVAIAAQFEADVLEGRFPCGELFKAAVRRHRADLEREGFPYRFDPERGAAAVRFLELLQHVDGPADLVGTRVVLQGWQVWSVIVLYGWVNRVTGYPRFRRATLFMPKGNGKTFLAAGLALYPLVTGTSGDKVFSAATTREQAGLSFKTARQMLLAAPEITKRFGIKVETHLISKPATGAAYRCFSSEAKSAEGVIPSVIIEDEIHAHPTRELHDNLRSSAAKRPDSRMIVISTAGDNPSPTAIGYEVYCYARDILLGSVSDDSQFALLIEADPGDDPWSPTTWRKANPNLGVSIDPVEVENEANEAKQRPGKQPSFFTKRLGRWVKSGAKWIAPAAWDKCFDPALKLSDFEGRPAYIGIDLAPVHDLTATAHVFLDIDDHGRRRYSVFAQAYLPSQSDTLTEGNDSIRMWADQGWIKLIGGPSLDLPDLRRDLLEHEKTFPGSEFCFDPHGAQGMTLELEREGLTVLEVRQGWMTQSEPMKELEAAVLDGRLRHDGNPVLAWCVCNIVCPPDSNGNLKATREHDAQKIDAGVALINAMSRASVITDSDTFSSGGLIAL